MRTPFLGPFNVTRSPNFADQQLVNLYPEIAQGGKDVGAFYMCPGLNLLAVCGAGPVRGFCVMAGVLYVVSGGGVYSVTNSWAATLIGSIPAASTPVSMITNGTQVAIFDGGSGYLVPGGYPLTGGTIGFGGSGYTVGDAVILSQAGGSQSASAIIEIAAVSGGVVTAFSITGAGAFPVAPSSFSQSSSDGSGSGFTLTSPTFGAVAGTYAIPLPFNGPVSASYQDGFGFVNVSGTNQWYQSDLFDLSVWQALNFSSADAKPDSIIAIGDIHREVFLFKQTNTEIWVNAGLPGFAFQRLDGPFIEMGCVAPFSVAKAGEVLLWLAQNDQGQGIVAMVEGYAARKVSSHAIDHAIQSYGTISDAIGYGYQQGGHLFYVLTFPTANATWVLDLTATEQAKQPMWHQRAALSNGALNRHWGNCGVFFGGKNVVGDYLTGNLYAFDLNQQLDNGAQRKWLRSWRALPKPSEQPVRFNSLRIDMETGAGVPAGTTPQCMLRCSDDGGHTWPISRIAAVGPTGATANRVKFNRLGSTRRNTGLDRIFELSSTDQFKVALIGAELDAG